LCTVHCALCSVHLHLTLYSVHCALCTIHCVLCTVHFTLCSVHYTLCTVHCTLRTETHLPKCFYLSSNSRILVRVCLLYQQVLCFQFAPSPQTPCVRYRGLPHFIWIHISRVTTTSQATASSLLVPSN